MELPIYDIELTPADLFARWIAFYQLAHREFIKDTPNDYSKNTVKATHHVKDDMERLAVMVMNSGDCGVTALAVGLALECTGGLVKYHDNGGHVYVEYQGKFWDALTYLKPHRNTDHTVMLNSKFIAENPHKLITGDWTTVLEQRLPYDELGAEYIRVFLCTVLGMSMTDARQLIKTPNVIRENLDTATQLVADRVYCSYNLITVESTHA